MRPVPALDGFRALAILLVVSCHFGLVRFGWSGVSMFFVLSGFLITRVLLEGKEASFGRYLGRFYWRRALRIFPIYYGLLGLIGLGYLLSKEPPALPSVFPALLTYTFNLAKLSPTYETIQIVNHLWSLSIEEQFYLVWPVVVFVLSRSALRLLGWAFVLLCPVLRLALGNPYVVYNFTLSHLDGFGLGALVACGGLAVARPERWLIATLGLSAAAGLAGMGLSLRAGESVRLLDLGWPLHLGQNRQYVWGYSLIHLSSAFAILALLEGRLAPRYFSHPAAVYIGRISYAVYLFHVPVLVLFGRLRRAHPAWFAGEGVRFLGHVACLALVLGVCHASLVFVETPLLRLKGRYFRSPQPQPE